MKRASLAVITAVVFVTSAARAQEPPACGASGPAVVLRADVLDKPLRARFSEQLRAALAARRIDLCTSDGDDARAIAGITLEATQNASGAVVLSVTVSDELTNKRVVRDVDLRDVPEDSRSLLLAQAADELLRASWAELLVAGAPAPKREVPAAVTEAVRPTDRTTDQRPRAPRVELVAGAGAEIFGSGQAQVGPDIVVGVFPLERFGAVLRGGMRTASGTSTQRGDVEASALTFAAGIVGGLLPRTGRLGLDAGPELFITRARYEGRPLTGSVGRNEEATALHLAAMLRGWLAITGPLRAVVDLRGGLPLHEVRVVDAEGTVAGVRGVLFGGQVGVGGAW